ncbi:3'(2'),5'-bisphosphate nucleotidase CysQ [Qipengyuania sp. 1NDH17]|uniref:3'(2'),5'-bisphosphate nucleotidase CysQ n=1 Tax=Qipengyuania polymorpha TaxID=2867234 RepID=A0ABS7J387_9SPHN|nr:3'(2'),5'-bisphosphate nucleotidase CysQ [Qipengyuania polymorpha]MBX7458815.1 3'(2'),5'-bisphosphate nucleotidase CysQ [Qipengyuania polymorpha]
MIDSKRLEFIVGHAGEIALGLWPGAGAELDSWEKTPGSPVCEADLAVDAFLKRELGALLPSAGWLSEETVDNPDRLERDLIWLVDPVDGTRDFIRGRKGWAVSVALISAGRPLIGTLCAPARGEVWQAVAGQGATLNGTRISASTRQEFAGARVPAADLMKQDRMLTRVEQPNSIALRIAMVADDRADLVATLRWGYEWDIAAAGLIAREAGAAISDSFGRKLNYNKRDPRAFGVIASAPGIHAATVEHLSERANSLARD